MKTIIFILVILFSVMITTVFTANDFYQNTQRQLSPEGEIFDHKCGFPFILSASNPTNVEMYNKLKIHVTNRATLDSTLLSPSGHFLISYSIEGFDAIPDYDRNQNGIRDYLEFVANSFDRAWQIEIDFLGFKAPPDINGNPRDVYPIECRNISVYGSTYWNPETDEIANLPGVNYVTTIEINTNFSFVHYPHAKDDIARDSMAIAVTAAHEFNHSLQAGYRLWPDNNNFFEDIWFIESSAVFMEEVVATEVNDYVYGSINYVQAFLNHTDSPLDESSNISVDYGKVMLDIMLGQEFGLDITRKVWTEIQNQRALPALEKVLLQLGSSLPSEMKNLATWIYFTGGDRYLPGQFFPDASIYPDLNFVWADTITSKASQLLSDYLPHLAFRWYESQTQTTDPPMLRLTVEQGSKAIHLSGIYIDISSQNFYQIPASVGFDLPIQILPQSLPFAVVSTASTGLSINYQLLSKPHQTVKASDLIIYPQPCVLSDNQPFLTFRNVPKFSTIYIFNSNGVHLQTLENKSEVPYLIWDLTTKKGKKMGSGVYIYRLKSDTREKTGKFVIIK